MSAMGPAFEKDFLRDFKRGSSGPGLALFGKHPAWNDHMDDFGLATASLRTCKRLLYLQGIAANAAREQSESTAPVPYRHSLLWLRGREAILLRLVESEDGRGRGYFPLVGALHFEIAGAEHALRILLPELRSFVDACRLLASREAVRDRHRHTQAHLHAELRRLPGGKEAGTATADPEELAALRELSGTGAFATRRVALSRYDHAESFAAICGAWSGLPGDRPLLISQGDSAAVMVLGAGEPERGDFWFLRGA